MQVKSESEVAQSCPTLSNPMDCSLPGSSIHGIFQARVLEWGAIAFSVVFLVLFIEYLPGKVLGIEDKKISKIGPYSQDAHKSRASHIAIQCEEFFERYNLKSN